MAPRLSTMALRRRLLGLEGGGPTPAAVVAVVNQFDPCCRRVRIGTRNVSVSAGVGSGGVAR
jgi:hypothetical protein